MYEEQWKTGKNETAIGSACWLLLKVVEVDVVGVVQTASPL